MDESTDVSYKSQMLIFVRAIYETWYVYKSMAYDGINYPASPRTAAKI